MLKYGTRGTQPLKLKVNHKQQPKQKAATTKTRRMAPRVTLSAVFLSGVTGMTVAGVSLLAYIRFQHPEQFADTAVKMSHPEIADDFTKKWGVFGTGISDAIPQSFKDLFIVPDLPEKIELQKRKRQEQIRQSLEDLRPKEK